MTAASTIASALRRSLESAERARTHGEHAYAWGYLTSAVEQALRELAVVEDSKPAGGEQGTGAGIADVAGVRSAPSTDHAPADANGVTRCSVCMKPRRALGTDVAPAVGSNWCDPTCSGWRVSDEEADRIADEVVGPVLSSHVQRSYPAGPASIGGRR